MTADPALLIPGENAPKNDPGMNGNANASGGSPRAINVGLMCVAVAYCAYKLATLFRYTVDVPFLDQWMFAGDLKTIDQQGLTWDYLWAPHNEHRIVLPKLIMVLLAHATRWNIRAESALVFALIGVRVAIVLVAMLLLGRAKEETTNAQQGRARSRLPMVMCAPIVCAFLLTQAQAENLLWGWQITLTLGALFTLLSCMFVVNSGWMRFGGAALCAVAAQVSFASGVVMWPVGALFVALQPRVRKRTRLLRVGIWLLIGSALTFEYNRGLIHQTPSRIRTVGDVAKYTVMFLGAPLTPLAKPLNQSLAWILGVLGLATFAVAVLGIIATKQLARWSWVVAWGLTAPVTALVTAWARLPIAPPEQGLSSRYVTLSVTMWASAAILLTATIGSRLKPVPTTPTTPTTQSILTIQSILTVQRKQYARVIPGLLISVAAYAIVGTADNWHGWAIARQQGGLHNRALLVSDSFMLEDRYKQELFPHPEYVERARPFLMRRHYSVFRNRQIESELQK